MGGYGSGGYSSKRTTWEFLQLDIRQLRRKEFWRVDWCGTVTWFLRGEAMSSAGLQVQSDRIVLNYTHSRNGGDKKHYDYPVFLDRTPCNFGGTRTWFRCPAQGCGRRVEVLYGGGVFACRHCYNLAYQSQREPRWERYLTRAQAIKRKLGADPADDFPDKPRGMHRRTYSRLVQEYEDADARSWSPWMLRMLLS